ncbi:MAG: hypothetical protein JXJ17_10970 [Anaerolineae bacterium]|nr:hypothetical protein [Anaerolineae bacterium]
MTEDQQTTNQCPKCELPREEGKEFCPECGYEFATGKEGAGPHEFAFPAVEDAYEPSGKTTVRAVLLMLLFGFLAGLVGGPLAYLVIAIAATIGAWIASSGICIAGLAALVIAIGAWLIAPAVLGGVISLLVGKAAEIGKSRNPTDRTVIALISGLVGFGSFLAVYYFALGPDSYDSFFDLLKLGWVLIAAVVVAAAGGAAEVKPFCEECEEWMKRHVLARRPIRQEKDLLDVLNAGDFEKLKTFPADPVAKSHCSIDVWHCGCENAQNYVNMHTFQHRYKYATDRNTRQVTQEDVVQARRVFSKAFPHAQVKSLLEMPSE